jgi:hypothetical protein
MCGPSGALPSAHHSSAGYSFGRLAHHADLTELQRILLVASVHTAVERGERPGPTANLKVRLTSARISWNSNR